MICKQATRCAGGQAEGGGRPAGEGRVRHGGRWPEDGRATWWSATRGRASVRRRLAGGQARGDGWWAGQAQAEKGQGRKMGRIKRKEISIKSLTCGPI
jgi:hypothetical protein